VSPNGPLSVSDLSSFLCARRSAFLCCLLFLAISFCRFWNGAFPRVAINFPCNGSDEEEIADDI
jgi:hypothetical protein